MLTSAIVTVLTTFAAATTNAASKPAALPVLPVKNLDKALSFWKEKLGVELEKAGEAALPAGTAAPGALRLVTARNEQAGVAVVFAVGETTAAADALRACICLPELGAARSAFPDAPSLTVGDRLYLFVSDQDGNRLCVNGPLARAETLFNGKDLTGWHPFRKGSWSVEEGVLVAEQGENNAGGWLVTDEAFGDFTLRLSFRLSRGANSGVCLRYPDDNSAPPKTGVEVQFCEVDPEYQTGSLLGDQAAPRGLYREGWNEAKIVVEGNLVVSYLNGKEAARATVDRLTPSGHLALQIHGGPQYAGTSAMFKDITVTKK